MVNCPNAAGQFERIFEDHDTLYLQIYNTTPGVCRSSTAGQGTSVEHPPSGRLLNAKEYLQYILYN
jgi:hypothetical protein